MNIESVKIHNILSIEDAYVEFDGTGLVLVGGWNYDSQRANGAGKTAIFNAITFALYDKLPRKVTATEILRRGSKEGSVVVTLSIGDSRYVVKRSRPKGVVFTKDGIKVEMTQAEWESVIKLSYTQYLVAAYCAQGNSTRFLSLNDADKKNFILQLLNLDEFAACKKLADDKVKNLVLNLDALRSKAAEMKYRADAYSESLVDEAACKESISRCEKGIAELIAKLAALNPQKPDFSKYLSLENQIAAKRTQLTEARTRRMMLHDTYRKINSKIRPFNQSNTCSACGSSLDTSAAKTAHEREVEELNNELVGIKTSIDECDNILQGEKVVSETAAKLIEKKIADSKAYDDAAQMEKEASKSLALKQQELENLSLKLENNSDLLSKINVLSKAHAKILTSSVDVEREIELYKTVSGMYSPTGAQAYILDSVVESFNDRVAEYVNLLWSNVTYELKSYKETVKGDLSAKFSEQLTMDGRDVSIGSLSGGEFRALSLCVDFALVDVMERQFGISVNPIVLDEPFDGLDSAGRELIIELLEKLAVGRQIVVVDHASEVKSMFSKVINVEKRNGVSSVSLQA